MRPMQTSAPTTGKSGRRDGAGSDVGRGDTRGSAARVGAESIEHVTSALATRHRVWGIGPWRFRSHRRAATTSILLLGLLVVVCAGALLVGEYTLAMTETFAALFGRTDDALASYFVTEVRAPRVVGAALVGSALGLSGSIFQTVSGNPLGSPDIIGFSAGAASGALVQLIVFGGGTFSTAIGAIIGGLATAAVVYALAWRNGLAGFRLVLVGIGIGAALSALNQLLVVRAPLDTAQQAAQWLAGSLNGLLWPRVLGLAVCVMMLLACAIVVFRPLAVTPLGDEVAAGLGVPVQWMRALAVLIAVIAIAVATATTGPIAFVALAAPHLARRVARTTGFGLVGPALMGALLVVVSDVLAQRLFAPTQLAVGVVTGALGGVYLVVLLVMERKRT